MIYIIKTGANREKLVQFLYSVSDIYPKTGLIFETPKWRNEERNEEKYRKLTESLVKDAS